MGTRGWFDKIINDYTSWPEVIRDTLNKQYPEVGEVEGNIVLAGMGGSSHGLLILSRCLKNSVAIVRDFYFRGFNVKRGDLVVIVSASGDTLEALSIFNEAVDRGADVVVIAGGGELAKKARSVGAPYVIIKTLTTSRSSFPSLLTASAMILDKAGFLPGVRNRLLKLADLLDDKLRELLSDSGDPSIISDWARGKNLVLYSSWLTEPLAIRFSAMLNEYAKSRCYVRVAPELAHNEIEALSGRDGVIILRDHPSEDDLLKRCMDAVHELAVEQGASVLLVETPREYDCLVRLAYTVTILDLTAIMIAAKTGVGDGISTPVIGEYKKKVKGP